MRFEKTRKKEEMEVKIFFIIIMSDFYFTLKKEQ